MKTDSSSSNTLVILGVIVVLAICLIGLIIIVLVCR